MSRTNRLFFAEETIATSEAAGENKAEAESNPKKTKWRKRRSLAARTNLLPKALPRQRKFQISEEDGAEDKLPGTDEAGNVIVKEKVKLLTVVCRRPHAHESKSIASEILEELVDRSSNTLQFTIA